MLFQSVRDSFLDEGIDEGVLQELKSLWEAKVGSLLQFSCDGKKEAQWNQLYELKKQFMYPVGNEREDAKFRTLWKIPVLIEGSDHAWPEVGGL